MITLAFLGVAAAATLTRWQIADRVGRATGTLFVNLVGSFVLGVLVGADTTPTVVLNIAALGSLTTFSTLMVEVTGQWGRSRLASAAYLAATVAGCVALAWCGLQLGTGS